MNIKIIIRNIQLYKLGLGDLNADEKSIYKYLKENVSGLNKYTIPTDDITFFGKTEDLIIFSYDSNNEWVYLLSKSVWSFLTYMKHINNKNISELLTWWFSLTLNLNIKNVKLTHVGHFE